MMITTPILVIIVAGILIKEKITWMRTLGIVIGFAGAGLLMINSGLNGSAKNDDPFGDLLIFINALSWGTYLVLSKPMMKKYHTVTILRWIFTFAIILVVPNGFSQFSEVQWHLFPAKIWFFVFFVTFFTTFIAYFLNIYALNALSPAVVSAYIYLQPLLTAIIAISTGHDTINLTKIISALLIFTGVFIVSFHSSIKVYGNLD
jgi:drug/metabolite transporter (DMT)-like permease